MVERVHITGMDPGLAEEAFKRVMRAIFANPDALERAMHDVISAARREAALEGAAP